MHEEYHKPGRMLIHKNIYINPLCLRHPDGLSHLSRRLLKVRGHLHTALIEQTELAEEQRQLAQVLLQFPKAILIRRLTLRHTIRQLERRQTKGSLHHAEPDSSFQLSTNQNMHIQQTQTQQKKSPGENYSQEICFS